jgi:hypothetical protein
MKTPRIRTPGMKVTDCEFEPEVLAAALQSRWPDRVDAQLREHAATCPICAETALVAGAIDQAGEESRAMAALPEAGRVWWLAQLRARREALQAAARPITLIQLIAFACATGLLGACFGACFGATSSWFQSALRWIHAQPVTGLLTEHALLAAGLAAVIVLIPAAAYFAFGKD